MENWQNTAKTQLNHKIFCVLAKLSIDNLQACADFVWEIVTAIMMTLRLRVLYIGAALVDTLMTSSDHNMSLKVKHDFHVLSTTRKDYACFMMAVMLSMRQSPQALPSQLRCQGQVTLVVAAL